MIRLAYRHLIIPCGDTGSFSVPIVAAASNFDVAVFTIFNRFTGDRIFRKEAIINNNMLTINFTHDDTIGLKPGKYVWDIKFYKNPQYLNGELIDGDEVNSYYVGFGLPICEIRDTFISTM